MLRRILLSLLSLMFTSALTFGQGSITGVVKDAVTGEAIIGANVLIQGTSTGASTDVEGKFEISKLAAGTYNVQVSFITYKTNLITDVVVEDAKRVNLEIPLAEESSQLQEIVIQAKRQTDTDFELLRSIKESKLVVSGITAEQISRSLDRDAAQVLRRVPGITIVDNQFVQIRGLSTRYNPVLLHNAYAPSLETDVRSFSFAMIPSSQLDRMLIFKSASADLPGDFAGGVVKVFTKSIPDENGIILDYSTQFRVGTTFENYLHQQKNKGFNTGFNTGFYDLPSKFPSKVTSDTQGDDLVNVGRSLKNLWTPVKGTASPDQRFTLTVNKKFKIGSVEIGNISALSYSNSFATYTVRRNDYTESGSKIDQNYGYSDKQYNQYVRTGFLFNWAFKLNPNHIIEFKNLYNQSSQDQYVDRTGVENSTGQKNGGFDKYYRGIYSGQLLGTHDFFNKRTTVEWVAGYNNSYRDQPDYKRFLTNLDGNGGAQIVVPNTILPNSLGRFYSKLNESAYSGGLSIKHRFNFLEDALRNPEIKGGFFFENKSRTFSARNIGYKQSASFDYSLQNLTIGELFQPQNINNTTGIQLGELTYKKDSYRASNNLLAYYLMTSIPFTKKIKLDAGARVENNLQQLHSYDDFIPAPVNPKNQINRILPSGNLSYNFTDKMLVRAAYSKTLNRPEFRELAPFSYFDFNFNFLYRGNPALRTATIQNIDLRWEYYPSKTEMVTFGLFSKHFKDPIETLVDINSPGGGLKQIFFKNANYANSLGAEVEIKKSLSGLADSKLLNNISLMFNATFIKSTVKLYATDTVGRKSSRPMQGQAPYVINSGIFYNSQESGWQVNLLYNIVGRSIVFVGNKSYKDVYTMPRGVLDLTFSKQIGERLQLKGGVTDILNQPVTFLQDGNDDGKFDRSKDQTVQKYKPGQVFSLGFTWKLL
ncbi:MAG TPA: TonB-dependent receptor [Cyclobacteriaceae bacterium]|nr:TonB-dependent receptor [Cyclobacteriaceae bacterium]